MKKFSLVAVLVAASALVLAAGAIPANASAPQNEIGHVDSISFQGGRGIVVTGWGLDAGTPADTNMMVDVRLYTGSETWWDYSYDSRGKTNPYDDGSGNVPVARPDIAATYPGAGPNHGFSIETDTSYAATFNVCVDLTDEDTGAYTQLPCTAFTVPAEHVSGHLDTITPGVNGTQPGVYVSGWMDDNYGPNYQNNLSLSYTTNTGNGPYAFEVDPTLPRPDVSAALPSMLNPGGFNTFLPTRPGDSSMTACIATTRDTTFTPCISGSWSTPSETAAPRVTGATGSGPTLTSAPGQTLGITSGAWSSPTSSVTDAWTEDISTTALPGGGSHPVGLGDIGHTFVAHEIAAGSNAGVLANAWTQSVTVAIPGMNPTTRLDGNDRYAVSVAESQDAFPSSALPSTVFVASGANFSDALSAGPAAAKLHAPLLLTQPNSLPAEVVAELQRLHPTSIVLVGGTASVAPVIQQQMNTIAPVTRIGGTDRYAVSRAVDDYAFPAGSARVWVVTGTNYPDAMSAGVAAASQGNPVLLVNGPAATTDSASTAELAKLHTTSATIAGGTASVSAGVAASLGTGIAVTRDAGADRFAASLSTAEDAFPSATNVYLATGDNYPDGLDTAALAGHAPGPLLLLDGDCVPQNIEQELISLHATTVTILGGAASLGFDIDHLTACAA